MTSNQPKTGRSSPVKTGTASSVPPGKITEVGKLRRIRFSPKLIIPIVVAALFGLALFIRIYLPYHQVFTQAGIKFTSNDAYFFMREVDNLVSNFPNHTSLDPYISFPRASGWVWTSFFTWFLAVPAWIIGLGSPSQHTIDVVGVFMPPVLGALTVILVYFIGKELFGRWAGVLAAGLTAILPGEFLGRSILGFTDTNNTEVPFSTLAMLFLILAVKVASQRQITFAHLRQREWDTIRKPVIYSLLAAVFLSIYIFAWLGALLFVFIAFVFFVVQFIIDHLKRRSTDYLSIVGVIFFSVTLLMALLGSSDMIYLVSLIIAVLAMPVLNGISRWMVSKKIAPGAYPLVLLALAAVGLGFLYLVDRSLFGSMVGAFSIFKPAGAQLTTIEMQPLISSQYGNPFAIAWGNFNVGFFLSFISLVILIYLIIRRGNAGSTLLIIWSLVILLATLGQRRFGYYLAINVAVLTGYLCWKALELAGFRELASSAPEADSVAAGKRTRRRRGDTSGGLNYVVMALSVLAIFFGVFFWSIEPAIVVASNAPYAPSDGWVTSLEWLKENSPEPMGSPDAYYQTYDLPPGGELYRYPESAYGVLAWWDYGYWITRIARRIPNANPSQDPQAIKDVAAFFTASDEKETAGIQEKLGSAYVIVDHETALSKLWAIITWAEKDASQYFDQYLVPQEDGKTLKPMVLYSPDYYRSMAVRLYGFDGKAQTPEKVLVVSYTTSNNLDSTGRLYKILNGAKQFDTYQEAVAYSANQTSGNYKLVGVNPLKSIVPLEALEHYKLIHGSESTINVQDVGAVPQVKIFEYVK